MTAWSAADRAAREGFVHEAVVYRSDDELLAVAVPFLRGGLAAGEPTLVAMTARRQRLLLGELGDPPGLTPLAADHYGDPLSVLRRNYRLFAGLARGGAGRIRMIGEVPTSPWPGWLRYEAAVNAVFARFPVSALCAYDARTTPPEVLADIERTHPNLALARDVVVPSPLYEPPAALLAGRARADADPLQALPPDLVLGDPMPEAARGAVQELAALTRLDGDSRDALRLSVGHVVSNARLYGRPPVRLRAWRAPDRVVVTVTDAGSGPADPFVGLLPRDPEAELEDANTLYVIHRALSDVSLFSDADGFTVRLTERHRT